MLRICQVAQKPTARPNFCDKREQKRIYSFMQNGAKISIAKLVKEYACPNPLAGRL